jgi:hypothetical protein
VGDHTSNGLIEDSRGRTEMERSMSLVETGGFAKICMVLHCTGKVNPASCDPRSGGGL